MNKPEQNFSAVESDVDHSSTDITPSQVSCYLRTLDVDYLLSLRNAISPLEPEEKRKKMIEMDQQSWETVGFKISKFEKLFPDEVDNPLKNDPEIRVLRPERRKIAERAEAFSIQEDGSFLFIKDKQLYKAEKDNSTGEYFSTVDSMCQLNSVIAIENPEDFGNGDLIIATKDGIYSSSRRVHDPKRIVASMPYKVNSIKEYDGIVYASIEGQGNKEIWEIISDSNGWYMTKSDEFGYSPCVSPKLGMICGTDDGEIILSHPARFEDRKIKVHEGRVKFVQAMSNGSIITASEDGTVRLSLYDEGEFTSELVHTTFAPISSIQGLRDGSILIGEESKHLGLHYRSGGKWIETILSGSFGNRDDRFTAKVTKGGEIAVLSMEPSGQIPNTILRRELAILDFKNE